MQRALRFSLGLSGIISSVLVIPTVAVSAYGVFSMPLGLNVASNSQEKLFVLISVSGTFWHLSVASTIYNLLGVVLERWITILRINPAEYLAKISHLVGEGQSNASKGRSKKWSKTAAKHLRRLPITMFLIAAWFTSGALAVLSVVLPGVQFLLYGNIHWNETVIFNSYRSYISVSGQGKRSIAIMYIFLLYVPTVCLVFAVALTTVIWRKRKSAAANLDSFEDGQAQAYFAKQHHGRRKSSAKTPTENESSKFVESATLQNMATHSAQVNSITHSNAEYSHKLEHSAQVSANCQKTDLFNAATDCIQLHQDNNTKSPITTSIPLPPDLLRHPTFKRFNTSSVPMNVPDLASTPLSVPVDSAQSFFGELSETKANLVTCTVNTMLVSPLLLLSALDVLSNLGNDSTSSTVVDSMRSTSPDNMGIMPVIPGNSSYNSKTGILSHSIATTSATFRQNHYNSLSQTTLDMSLVFLLLHVVGSLCPFFMLYKFSMIFRSGMKAACKCRRENTKSKVSTDEQRRPPAERNSRRSRRRSGFGGAAGRPTSNKKCLEKPRDSSIRLPPSQEERWIPKPQFRTSYLDTRADIEERYDADTE